MLDQMFTAENFRKIFDRENRRGHDVASRYFPNLEEHTSSVREAIKNIRDLRARRGTLNTEEFERQLTTLKETLAERKSAKSNAINAEMESLSAKVAEPRFKIALSQKMGPHGKSVFCIDQSPETFFSVKQLQHNIHRIYGVKQSNRHDLVCRIRDTVHCSFPFEIVRTDISSFYESIDRKRLLRKLEEDQLLSLTSKKYIKQILDSYENISGNPIGIPRGVGISAYLAELYLRPIDKAIQEIPGIVLYGRYVDDIVAIFARPPIGAALGSYSTTIINVINQNGLVHNAAKTKEFKLADKKPAKFEYLGYRFLLERGSCTISPSAAKIVKYRTRLNAAFKEYHRRAPTETRCAARSIVARIKFLTGNTRLLNSKSGAVTGIYYNNSIVTEKSSFEALDKILKRKINSIKRKNIRKRLKQYGFSSGFETRRFHNFSTSELHRIVEAWKYV